jgi:hypothetical protein
LNCRTALGATSPSAAVSPKVAFPRVSDGLGYVENG